MPVPVPLRTPRAGAVVAVALTGLLLAGCAAGAQPDGGGASDAPVVRLADSTPLADPASYVGPSTAVLGAPDGDPLPAAEPQLPVTLTDVQGTEVTVTDVSRVLALDLYGTLSQITYDLGLGERLVGRDTSSSFPGSDELPLVTQGGHTLNGEAVLELAPTVLITDTTLGPWDVVLQVRDAGIPVVVVDSHRTVDGVGTLIGQVAAALGVPGAGEQLAEATAAEITAKVAEIAAVAPQEPERRLRMLFLYLRGQAGVYYMFGRDSGADSLITALSGRDVAGEIGWSGMKPLTDEGLVAAQPDLVLVMTEGLRSVGGVEGLLEQVPALAQTPAGQRHRIVDMADSQVLGFGPRTADVLDALATAVYAPGATVPTEVPR
ncbi:heme/hemin ABC transporter substrate-binding protein [Modestobacter roseus]|uniref:Iron complex transport system substrate-binding protein n=1 Tax=Modestobacter roseus TaxID=1181884 RepID=A0A562IPW5_9ACTN|nr:ABC transporter substrate-binding protein [Modestobacter roseus]TWH73057.1 iron complex transport system substrate-binding protein [Modestobacter roseus]